MRTVAILPIKSFAQAKQRLRDGLSPHDRRALVEAMFADALVALGRVAALERIVVVSGDRVAQRIAGGYGASIVEDDERGHNAAAARGVEAVLEDGIERALLVPGDCPMLSPRDIEALLDHPVGERSVADRPRPPRHRNQRAAADPARRPRPELRAGQPPAPSGRGSRGGRACRGRRARVARRSTSTPPTTSRRCNVSSRAPTVAPPTPAGC